MGCAAIKENTLLNPPNPAFITPNAFGKTENALNNLPNTKRTGPIAATIRKNVAICFFVPSSRFLNQFIKLFNLWWHKKLQ